MANRNSADLFIHGEWLAGEVTHDVRLPFDGTLVGAASWASREHVDRAVAAARVAAPVMAEMSNAERSDLLFRMHALLSARTAEIAEAITLETGKPIKEGRIEAGRGLETLWAAVIAARELRGEVVPIDAAALGKGRYAMTLREPRGVIGAITPFNVPFNLAIHKIAPALGSGNAVVHKAAEQTPLSAVLIARAIEEAGAPKGAYNLIHGDGEIGAALVAHPDIDMITFTGSVAIGKAIRAAAGLKKVTLELGGNSAVIVDPDADLETVIARASTGAFMHSGQLCISVQRIYAQDDVYAKLAGRIKDSAASLKIGHPMDEATDISSLIDEEAATRVATWVNEVAPGSAHRDRATVAPVVVENVPDTARLSCQEVFGPVVALYRYAALDDAIARVNATPYGLQAGVFTRDISRAFYAARKLKVGGVIINDIPTFRADHMPYGGMKESGDGREGPRYAMEEMTEAKLVVWR